MDLNFVEVIAQVGFPIAVASYTLIVLNNTIKQNTSLLEKIALKLDLELTQNDKK